MTKKNCPVCKEKTEFNIVAEVQYYDEEPYYPHMTKSTLYKCVECNIVLSFE